MFKTLFIVGIPLLCILPARAQQQDQDQRSGAVTFIGKEHRVPDLRWQQELRSRQAWRQFVQAHPGWVVEFNESNGKPHRAYGPPIATQGATATERALDLLTHTLAPFGVPVDELQVMQVYATARQQFVHFAQTHDGRPVLFGHVLVKLDMQGNAIAFGLDAYDHIPALEASLSDEACVAAASQGLWNVTGTQVEPGLRILPVPGYRSVVFHAVKEVSVRTRGVGRHSDWQCWVDAGTGALLYRRDRVVTENDDAGADVTMSATVSAVNTLSAPTVEALRNLHITVGGSGFTTDVNGNVASGITGPVQIQSDLEGDWSTVFTNGITPSLTGQLQEGGNQVSFDSHATLQERSAYYHVNNIHDHINDVIPGFDGMDMSLPTNVDLTNDNCNAFYDGSSINFYAQANDCYSMALISDVVYHEYGHGINHTFYQSLGASYNNGAMDEGYADFWAFSLTQLPILAQGYKISNPNSFIRRYDENRKVYPQDITGEVHADGEIIAGAWWDTYLQLGNDMPHVWQLFGAAYPGLQAQTPSGQEGQAYRDVLLDVLQADDDDSNLLNGTPNGAAIAEAFRLHGITLLAGFDIQHTPADVAPPGQDIVINATASVTGVFAQYLQGVQLDYRINLGPWQQVLMSNTGGDNYTGTIPAQPIGTVISYYIGLLDVGNVLSSVTPIAASDPDPNLPNYMLVGFDLERTENADNLNQLGDWQLGVPGDNNTTGTWVVDAPQATFSTVDNSVIQTGEQHTPGGELCFLTGNGGVATQPGDDDVDGGSTTLLGDPIDLHGMVNPTFTLYRWYTNSPPGGANPGEDRWYVQISNNNGADWVFVENTRSDDRSWRKLAFRVQDYLGPSNTVRLRFIASDSVRVGEDLDGGSLVEAAVDDIQLWDNANVGIEEQQNTHITALYPDPANNEITMQLMLGGQGVVTADIIDPSGRVVSTTTLGMANGQLRAKLDVSSLSAGGYVLRARWQGGSAQQRFSVVR